MSYSGEYNYLGAAPQNSFPLQYSGVHPVSKPNMLVIGDSRTYQNSSNNYWPNGYRFNSGYLIQALSFVRDLYNYRQDYNLGINGDTAQGIDVRKATDIPKVLSRRPAHEEWDAVYWVDINDAIGGISSAAFLGYFASTMKYMMTKGFRNIYVMSGIPYPQGYGGESAGTHAARITLIKAYNAGMKDFVSKYPEVLRFVDNYAAYGSAGDPDVSNPLHNNGTDIHPGCIGATVLGRNLANAMIKARGMPALINGQILSPNPTLADVESIIQSGTQNNFYCSGKTSGVVLQRSVNDGALIVTLDSLDGTPRSFNIFNNTTSWNDTLMPGDVVQACLEIEYLEVSGQPVAVEVKIQEDGGSQQAYACGNPGAGYSKGAVVTGQRQVYLSDPFLVQTGKKGKYWQPYMNSATSANTKMKFKIYEVSCRRLYATPNAEYSAAATIPHHRRNIKCLTSTASAGFTLTLLPLYWFEDGTVLTFRDSEGAASTKNVTLAAAQVANNGANQSTSSGTFESIINGASSASTLVLSADRFNIKLMVDRGANAWVVV